MEEEIEKLEQKIHNLQQQIELKEAELRELLQNKNALLNTK